MDRVLPLILPRIFRGVCWRWSSCWLAAVLGLFVARRATGRVATLRDAARRVGEGDLGVRVAPRGSDELDELARAFDRMVAELGDARSRLGYLQKVSAWQEVARRLAHEIKNPLTPIQLAVQELASKYRGGDPAYERLLATAQEILNEEVGAIRRLVDDFSAFAKLPKVEPAPVDLAQVVEDFARAIRSGRRRCRSRTTASVGALCDRMMLGRVLANLVENAVQAARGGRAKAAGAHRRRVQRRRTRRAAAGRRQRARRGRRGARPDLRPLRHQQGGRHRAGAGHRPQDHARPRRRRPRGREPSPLGGARFVVTLPTAGGSVRPAREPQRRTTAVLAEPRRRARPPRSVASRASSRPPRTQARSTPASSTVSVVGLERLLAAVGQRQETVPRRIDARRPARPAACRRRRGRRTVVRRAAARSARRAAAADRASETARASARRARPRRPRGRNALRDRRESPTGGSSPCRRLRRCRPRRRPSRGGRL